MLQKDYPNPLLANARYMIPCLYGIALMMAACSAADKAEPKAIARSSPAVVVMSGELKPGETVTIPVASRKETPRRSTADGSE